MTAYAIAHLRNVNLGAEIADYLKRIDATLEPHGGRFLVHGGQTEVVEGPWDGNVVVIAFPGLEEARAWHASPGYQAILPFRTENRDSRAFIVEGAPEGYRASSLLPVLGLA